MHFRISHKMEVVCFTLRQSLPSRIQGPTTTEGGVSWKSFGTLYWEPNPIRPIRSKRLPPVHTKLPSRRKYIYYYFLWRCGTPRALASSFLRFLDHTQRRITVGRTPLDEWSARRRDLYLTTHNTHNRQKSMPPVGFETTISAGERPQTYVLDRAATGTGIIKYVRQ